MDLRGVRADRMVDAVRATGEVGPVIELVLEDPSLTVAQEFENARLLHRKRRAVVQGCRERYESGHEESGLCLRCQRPAKRGGKHCAECTEKNAARMRKRRAYLGAKSRPAVTGNDRLSCAPNASIDHGGAAP